MTARHLSDCLGSHNNRFDQIRLAAALAVVIWHAWPIALGHEDWVPFVNITILGMHKLALHVFFFISGLLITESAIRHQGKFVKYTLRRVFRIIPGLAVNALIIPVILIVFGAWSLESVKDVVIYAFRLVTLGSVQYDYEHALGGIPAPHLINGSVWSLRHEVIAYAILGAAILLNVFRSKHRQYLLLAGFVAFNLFAHLGASKDDHGILYILAEGNMVMFSFMLGMFAHQFARHIPMNVKLFIPGLALVAVGSFAGVEPLREVGAIVTTLALCLLIAFPKGGAKGLRNDISYGVYIYSWPIQQLIMYIGVHYFGVVFSPELLVVLCLPPVLLFGYFSWVWVERPAMQWLKNALKSDVFSVSGMRRVNSVMSRRQFREGA